MNQKKVKWYAMRVLSGALSIEDVPEEYRAAVAEYLENM